MTTRRAFLAASLAAPALALSAYAATAQPVAIGGIRVDTSRLVPAWGAHAAWVKTALERELATAFGPALQRGGPLLYVTVRAINLSSYAAAGGGKGGGSAGNFDTFDSETLLLGKGDRAIAKYPILSTVDAGSAGAWYLPDIDQRRLDQLVRNNAAWIKRYVAG
ncbi:hypothetical protein DWF00_07335 [Bosea caraganae]|uniref:DUF3016 domain-containing protein n=1 Tax=Bosea caraganae TaxID=2763117 RepID=A0A370L240_9HYPH|nr:hypothetical protein [Bosea caraganae]RDJ21030.1 hypothetical protein DWE98_22130 [Bosea caraganae]RDJ28529.1 hypothetical protein DWF00_07335 [Bosea caraganae]